MRRRDYSEADYLPTHPAESKAVRDEAEEIYKRYLSSPSLVHSGKMKFMKEMEEITNRIVGIAPKKKTAPSKPLVIGGNKEQERVLNKLKVTSNESVRSLRSLRQEMGHEIGLYPPPTQEEEETESEEEMEERRSQKDQRVFPQTEFASFPTLRRPPPPSESGSNFVPATRPISHVPVPRSPVVRMESTESEVSERETDEEESDAESVSPPPAVKSPVSSDPKPVTLPSPVSPSPIPSHPPSPLNFPASHLQEKWFQPLVQPLSSSSSVSSTRQSHQKKHIPNHHERNKENQMNRIPHRDRESPQSSVSSLSIPDRAPSPSQSEEESERNRTSQKIPPKRTQSIPPAPLHGPDFPREESDNSEDDVRLSLSFPLSLSHSKIVVTPQQTSLQRPKISSRESEILKKISLVPPPAMTREKIQIPPSRRERDRELETEKYQQIVRERREKERQQKEKKKTREMERDQDGLDLSGISIEVLQQLTAR